MRSWRARDLLGGAPRLLEADEVGDHPVGRRAEPGRQLAQQLLVAADEGEPRAGLRERPRGCLADPRGGAAEHDDAAARIGHRLLLRATRAATIQALGPSAPPVRARVRFEVRGAIR